MKMKSTWLPLGLALAALPAATFAQHGGHEDALVASGLNGDGYWGTASVIMGR